MPIFDIFDPADPRLAPYVRLTDVALRTSTEPVTGIFIAEGRLVIERAMAAGHRPISAIANQKWADAAATLLPNDVAVFRLPVAMINALTGFRVHRGALAAFVRPAPIAVIDLARASRRLMVLEELVDHTNVGAIARSAAGLAFDGLILSPGCADPLYRRSVKTSMGATLTMPFARATNWPEALNELKACGYQLIGLSPTGQIGLAEARVNGDRLAIVLGTEGSGLSQPSKELLDLTVRIPMTDRIDSLNVAVAAGIACHHFGIMRT